MKRIFHKTLCILPILALLSGLSSCLNEKTDGCIDPRGNVRIVVRLDAETTRISTYTQDVQSVHLYVFDSDNTLIHTENDMTPYVPGEEYEIWLDLRQGTYNFVIWTNLGDYYRVEHAVADNPSCDDSRLIFNHLDEVSEIIPDLHYGTYRNAVVVDNKENVFPVEMILNTNLINVTVLGAPETDDTYCFTIADDNCCYTFDNAFAAHSGFEYVCEGTCLDDELHANLKILKLAANRTPVFTFTNTTTDQTLFTDNLVSMIQRAYALAGEGVNFDRTHVYDLTLKFDINMGVSVTVNNWEYTHQPGELGK